ncbi:LysR substrate-binding domain-containing protein [Robbsia andropogonis]|uniref:LysR substrate-binding domain-containing protein n=1 Tax=Robbsia andropogonis TaxID=28092 RepID=UPI0009E1E029
MGTRLLNRTTRSVSLTEAGKQFMDSIVPWLMQLRGASDDFTGEKGRLTGTLRINGDKSAFRLLLASVVPALLRRHPDVQLDLVADGRFVDIVAQGFDAGIRLAEAVPKDMIAVPLSVDTQFIAVAAPRYLKNNAP